MDPATATLVSGGVFALFFILTILNFIRTGMKMSSGVNTMFQDPNEENFGGIFGSVASGFGLHALFGGLSSLSFVAFVACFVWFLVTKLG
jgi:hypothetical protein